MVLNESMQDTEIKKKFKLYGAETRTLHQALIVITPVRCAAKQTHPLGVQRAHAVVREPRLPPTHWLQAGQVGSTASAESSGPSATHL